MANTKKQNFRCDDDEWAAFWKQVTEIANGWEFSRNGCVEPVNMSTILRAEVRQVNSETAEQTARRLGLVKKGATE